MTDVEVAIRDQPDVVRQVLDTSRAPVEEVVRFIRSRGIRQIGFLARGSSMNAARYGACAIGVLGRIPTMSLTPSMFTSYGFASFPRDFLVIAVSQSGGSSDICRVVEVAGRQGVPSLAITNTESSVLAGSVDHCVPLGIGVERTIAAITSYTATVTVLAMIGALLEEDRRLLDQLMTIPEQMSEGLGLLDDAATFDDLGVIGSLPVIGRGFNAATAWEAALKVKELARIPSEAFTVNDFIHGPIATLRRGSPILTISPPGATFPSTSDLVRRTSDRGARNIVVGEAGIHLPSGSIELPVPTQVPEWLSPLTTILACQLLAVFLAVDRGEDPDKPPGLTKVISTT